MKRLILFSSVFMLMTIVSTCKKEIIEPNNRVENDGKGALIDPSYAAPAPNTGTTGEITDPNDDDYTRRPKKTIKQ